jgi:hypothetical protein
MHKIAVYFSGRIRGYEHTIDKLKTYFFNKYDCDFFWSVDLEKSDEYHEKLKEILKPKATYYEKYDRLFSELPVTPCECRQHSTLSMFYHNYYCQKLILDYIKATGQQYHAIVKFRIDIDSISDFIIPDVILQNTVYIPNGNSYRGICDQIAFGSVSTMIIYGTVYVHIPTYIYSKKAFLSSEYLLNFHINENNVNIFRFPYEYELHNSRYAKPIPIDSINEQMQ